MSLSNIIHIYICPLDMFFATLWLVMLVKSTVVMVAVVVLKKCFFIDGCSICGVGIGGGANIGFCWFFFSPPLPPTCKTGSLCLLRR